MIRSGQVIGKEKNGLLVRFERMAACHGCNACGRDKKTTSVLVHGDAEVGDIVSVEMPDAQVLKASLLVYLIPLLGFLLGLFLGSRLWPGSDLAMVACGLIGLGLSALGLKLADGRLGSQAAWQARIIRVESRDNHQQAEQ